MLPKKLIAHCTGSLTGPTNRQFKTVEDLHKREYNFKGSLGYYCGYHAFIEWDGTLIECRADTDIGAHTIGRNGDSIGVCLAGDFDQQMPSDAQIATLKEYLITKMKKWNISAKDVRPHRYWATYSLKEGRFVKNTSKYETWDGCLPYKTCYGSLLADNWAQLLVAPPPSVVSIEEVSQAVGILERLLTLLKNYLTQRKALGMPPHERFEAN